MAKHIGKNRSHRLVILGGSVWSQIGFVPVSYFPICALPLLHACRLTVLAAESIRRAKLLLI